MSSARAKLKLAVPPTVPEQPRPTGVVGCGTVVALQSNGLIVVESQGGSISVCAWLENSGSNRIQLMVGDSVLLVSPADDVPGVVIGKIGRYGAERPDMHVNIEAAGTLTLTCGASSVALRADGKVMIRGEDVLVRAKGTKRIRAGTVSIN